MTEVDVRRADTQISGWASKRRAGETHEGFYTQKQIRRIVDYAAARHINIIPEIGMPGHAAAAIAAYPELGTLKKDVPVMDHFDEAVDIYDPYSPRVYKILGEILDEVVTMFPGSIIHLGDDEVHFTHWKNSKSIAEMMKREKLASMADVQLDFNNRIARMITVRGKIPMGSQQSQKLRGHRKSQGTLPVSNNGYNQCWLAGSAWGFTWGEAKSIRHRWATSRTLR